MPRGAAMLGRGCLFVLASWLWALGTCYDCTVVRYRDLDSERGNFKLFGLIY